MRASNGLFQHVTHYADRLDVDASDDFKAPTQDLRHEGLKYREICGEILAKATKLESACTDFAHALRA